MSDKERGLIILHGAAAYVANIVTVGSGMLAALLTLLGAAAALKSAR